MSFVQSAICLCAPPLMGNWTTKFTNTCCLVFYGIRSTGATRVNCRVKNTSFIRINYFFTCNISLINSPIRPKSTQGPSNNVISLPQSHQYTKNSLNPLSLNAWTLLLPNYYNSNELRNENRSAHAPFGRQLKKVSDWKSFDAIKYPLWTTFPVSPYLLFTL